MAALRISILLVLACSIIRVSGLSCVPCIPEECEKSKKTGCKVGFEKDMCGCCDVCAKDLGEDCGGQWKMWGVCGDDLKCFEPPCDRPIRPKSIQSNMLMHYDPSNCKGTCVSTKPLKNPLGFDLTDFGGINFSGYSGFSITYVDKKTYINGVEIKGDVDCYRSCRLDMKPVCVEVGNFPTNLTSYPNECSLKNTQCENPDINYKIKHYGVCGEKWSGSIYACIKGNNYKTYSDITSFEACKAKCVEVGIVCQSAEYNSQKKKCHLSKLRSDSSAYTEPCYLEGWIYAEINLNVDEEPVDQDDCYRMKCSSDYQPVCGSNAITYSNYCQLLVSKCDDTTLTMVHEGKCVTHISSCMKSFCPIDGKPVCASDGETYGNECLFNNAKCFDETLVIVKRSACTIDDGCISIGSKCLTFSEKNDKLSWNDAAVACAAKGGQLAILTEDAFFTYLLRSTGEKWSGSIYACIKGNNYKTYSDITSFEACKAKCVEVGIVCQSAEYNSQMKKCHLSKLRSDSSAYAEPCYLEGWIYAEINLNVEMQGDMFWAGGSDRKSEGTWLWMNGEPFNGQFQWKRNSMVNNAGQNCLEVKLDGGYDQDCNEKKRYICEPDTSTYFKITINNGFDLSGFNGLILSGFYGYTFKYESGLTIINGRSFGSSTCFKICTLDYRPLCGTDNKDYINECSLQNANCEDFSIKKKYNGRCGGVQYSSGTTCIKARCLTITRDSHKLCGSDGIIYESYCHFSNAQCKNIFLQPKGMGFCVGIVGPDDCKTYCTLIYQPVCGSDGKTYGNECLLKSAKCDDRFLYKIGDGICGECKTDICTTDYKAICVSDGKGNEKTYFNECMFKNAQCDDDSLTIKHQGECVRETGLCIQYSCLQGKYDPVCGSDGKTYFSECDLNNAKCENNILKLAYNGVCEVLWRSDLRCGSGKYKLPSGKPAQCNPNSEHHYCCSASHWCGHTKSHCSCNSCINYKKINLDSLLLSAVIQLQGTCGHANDCRTTLQSLEQFVGLQREHIQLLHHNENLMSKRLLELEQQTKDASRMLNDLVAYHYDCPYPFDFLESTKECFYFHTTLKTYQEAKIECTMQNADIAIPANFKALSDYMFEKGYGLKPETRPFIGARSQSGEYKWLDNTAVTVDSWQTFSDLSKEYCVVFCSSCQSKSPLIADSSTACTEKRPFICKKKK